MTADPQTESTFRDTEQALRNEITKLRAEVEMWKRHAKLAIWSDSEECKLLTADNERLRAALLSAPTVDIKLVTPDREYSTMSPLDCYEAGLLDGAHQAREAIKKAARAALGERTQETDA